MDGGAENAGFHRRLQRGEGRSILPLKNAVVLVLDFARLGYLETAAESYT